MYCTILFHLLSGSGFQCYKTVQRMIPKWDRETHTSIIIFPWRSNLTMMSGCLPPIVNLLQLSSHFRKNLLQIREHHSTEFFLHIYINGKYMVHYHHSIYFIMSMTLYHPNIASVRKFSFENDWWDSKHTLNEVP